MKRLLFNSFRTTPSILRPSHVVPPLFFLDTTLNKTVDSSCPQKIYHQLNQIRCMGRNDGARFVLKPRPVSKKQKTKYHRKLKEMEEKQAKHSKPGSKAGPRREFVQDQLQYYTDKATGKFPKYMEPDELEYDYGDAVLDDLIGNTAHLTSIPNPKPVYLGHKYETYHNVVAGIMKEYNHYLIQSSSETNQHLHKAGTLAPPLPTDYQLSLLLRAYRDHVSSSRSKPLGIAPVLRLLSQELHVPLIALKELSYTTFMTCASTPTEGRRIMKMMKDYNHPISSYSYSILVHIHSRKGDFRGAAEVLSEMSVEGVAPSLAAYTSFLAACYKVCNQGAISQAIKAEAGKLAWDKWKELRIIGLEPDVMTYGAILRIMAARGLPEQAINIIDEMRAANVKPTSLIFSSALKAVARSHANALRFHGGRSSKNKRRELITAHHGNMARSIVIAADNAHVEQDEGFVSALMLCAATAGDSATVKAIYLASEVRKLDSLRLIGGEEHLRLLQGSQGKSNENGSALALDYSSSVMSESNQNQYPSFEEREYGKDTRKVSALLYSYAQAIESGGLGNIWSGGENKGYLCENSLRLITKRRVPEYVDTSIPGMSGTETGLTSLNWEWADNDLDALSKQERRQTVRKIKEYKDAGNRIDELDPMFARMHMMDDDDESNDEAITQSRVQTTQTAIKSSAATKDHKLKPGNDDAVGNSYNDAVQEFEYDLADIPDVNVDSFEEFYKNLRVEFEEDSEENVVNEESARELFELIRAQHDSGNSGLLSDGDDLQLDNEVSVEGDFRGRDVDLMMDDAVIEDRSREEERNLVSHVDDFDSRAEVMLNELKAIQENFPDAIKPFGNASVSLPNSADTDELDLLLQGFPAYRMEKVRAVFTMSLGNPSILSLVPTVREVMPERISNSWLKKKNITDALAAIESADPDIHILNSMLQVLSKSGSIDKALAFYGKEFKAHDMTPNSYSDRIVLQMLVDSNRISRALDFKSKIEAEGRHIDLLSYGSLIEYYGNHGEIGDAIITLKECVSIHKTYPGEKSLKQLRLICRKQGLEDDINLLQLIGEDPMAWLREGESKLKREYSKKGRRYVDFARNRMLQI